MLDVEDPNDAAVVHAYFHAISADDFNAWLELFEHDAVVHDPVGAEPVEGRTDLGEIWKVIRSPFKELKVESQGVFWGGPGAAVHWSANGTGVNGDTIEFGGITVFELNENRKICTLMSYWDPAAMMIELAGEQD